MLREKYIDIVKGIAIWGIVLSHYEENVLSNGLRMFIGAFMVMAFYISSGWLSSMKTEPVDTKQLFRKRWKQLMVPYLYWSAIILVFDFILLCFGYYDFLYIGKEIYKTIMLRGIGTLWFLPALFVGELMWNYFKDKKYKMIIILLISIIYIELYNIVFSNWSKELISQIINVPFRSIYNILIAFIGVVCGYYSFRFLGDARNPKISFLIGLLLCILGYYSLFFINSTLHTLRLICTSVAISIGLFLVFKLLPSVRLLYFFEYWGKNSLNLMVTHYSIVLVLFRIVVENCIHAEFIGSITIIAFLLSIPIQWALIPLVSKYAKFTLGK